MAVDDTLKRIESCGRKLKIPQAEIDALLNDARTVVEKRLRLSVKQGALPDIPSEDIVVGAMKRQAARVAVAESNAYKRGKILAGANVYADTPRKFGLYFLRLVDGSSGAANNTVTPFNSAAKQYSLNVAGDRAILSQHWRVLKGAGGAKVVRWLRGEAADGDLTAAELSAARDAKVMLEQQRLRAAAAKGLPSELDDSPLLSSFIRPSRLVDDNEDAFVEFMRGKVRDDDGYWLANDAANLRELYARKMGERDNALDSQVADEFDDLRPMEFVDADAYLSFMDRYTGAKSFGQILANHADMTARRSALVSVFGSNIDKTRSEFVDAMTNARIQGQFITAFNDSLDNLMGRHDMLVVRGKERPSQLGLLAQSGVGFANITALGWSFLTSFMGFSRAFLQSTAMHGVLPAMIRLPQAVLSQVGNLDNANAVLRSMRIVSQRHYAQQTNNLMQLGDAQDQQVGRRAAERFGGGLRLAARVGTLTASGFDIVNDFTRRSAVLSDNQGLARLLKAGKEWDNLGALQREFLQTGGIGAEDWSALKFAFDKRGARVENGGLFVDFDAIDDVRIMNKWQGRANKLADEVSGVVSQRTDSFLKMGSGPGGGRAFASAATGLFRDPLAGTFLLGETMATHWRAGGIHKIGAAGVVPAFALMNFWLAHFRSQIIHYAENGEFHDYLDSNREQYIQKLFYFYSLELMGAAFVSIPWLDNDSAIVGGGPASEGLIKGLRGAVRAIHDDDAELRKFIRGDSDYNEIVADGVERILPAPGPIRTLLAKEIRE